MAALAMGGAMLRGEPRISEFMASNRTGLTDEDGAFSDWIEIHNPDTAAIDLTGWYLTDNAGDRRKWRIPAVTVPAGGQSIFFASGKNRTNPAGRLHTNFSLAADEGEYLGLVRPDGITVAHEYAPRYPAQEEDVSYGEVVRAGEARETVYFPRPTPGAANPSPPGTTPFAAVGFSRSTGLFAGSFPLELTGAGAGQVIRYLAYQTLADPTKVPALKPDSPAHAAALTIDKSIEIRTAVFSTDGTVRGPVAVAHYTRLADGVRSLVSRLPVVVFDTTGTGPLSKDGIDYRAWMYLQEPSANDRPVFDAAPTLVTPLTINVRGHTSAEFPKRGYNLAFKNAAGRRQPQALLGMPAHDRWSVVTAWKFDPAYLKNAFMYGLSNDLGRWAARTRFAEVYLQTGGDRVEPTDYAGIYVLTDRLEIGPARVAVPALTSSDNAAPAISGGYLLKLDNPVENEFSWRTKRDLPEDPETAVILVEPDAGSITAAQRSYLVDAIQRMEDALFADRDTGFAQRTYLEHLDRASWVDHHILNTLASNPDAFEHSAFFVKPRNGPLQAGPVWDFDKALGAEAGGFSNRLDTWSNLYGPDIWQSGWWGVIARDPEFIQAWIDRWQSLRAGPLADSALGARNDALAAEIGDAAARRDAARWPDNASPYGSYAGQVAYQKDWVTRRSQWIDRQWVAPPTVTLANAGATLVFRAPAGAQLAYATDGADPRSLGGGVAPNAVVAPGPISLPAGANVHVRSYQADRRGVFPGSPWSSAVGGSGSTPLAPVARIVNLSTRAWVGQGEDALIAGVVIADTGAKRYLARGVGPGLLAFGAADFVADPQLALFSRGGAELLRNNGWQEGPDAAQIPGYAQAVGAFPLAAGSRDAALASELAGGLYTMQVSTPSGQPGVGLVELYELTGNGRTINLSSRARVLRGDGVLIGGFVIQGSARLRMLVRAVGPTLGTFGVSAPLADPVLTLYSGANALALNDRWEAGENAPAVRTASENVGAFALRAGSEDAALLVTLGAGAYTAIVEGKNNSEGVALLEIYVVP